MDETDIQRVIGEFRTSARLANQAGFDVVELHGAHGFLIHEFLSPLSNHRTDRYGGSLDNRLRFAREVVAAVREEWPSDKPLFFRVSSTDWVEGGWDVDQSVALATKLRDEGVDLMDCSSGGTSPEQQITAVPNYQVPNAEEIRERVGMATAAVGLITSATQAEEILQSGQADLIMLGRAFLQEHWVHQARVELGANAPLIPEIYRSGTKHARRPLSPA
jgi:2,4-dienoyl-CoA reductase-like NADH-dependent reductase (Old Yellow Enzyme family)